MTLDFANICRLCGKSGGLTYVFEENDLWHKVFMCFGVKIQKEDEITQQICKSCYFFTNTVYEFRLSSLQHETDLRRAYLLARSKAPDEDFVEEKTPITYPSEENSSISQESFLNAFNLEHKNHHSSVLRLKRKFPLINIPKEWCELDIEPEVRIDLREYDNYVSKKVKTNEDLGIWSVRNKLSGGKHQPDLVLTRVRPNHETTSNSDISEISKPQNKKKFSPRKRRRRQWQRGNINRNTKKISPRKVREENDHDDFIYESNNIPSESDSMSIHSTMEQDRNVLKNLLHTDAHLNGSLSDSSSFPHIASKGEDFCNLLITVGEEVKTYICQTCNKVFDTQSALTIHKKYSHKPSLRCMKCSESFNIVESLVKHNATCHPETVASTSQTNNKTENKTNETQEENMDETSEKSIDSAHKSVARKRTGGIPLKHTVYDSETEPKIEIDFEPKQETDYDAYVISSDDDDDDDDDDDVQITNVISNSNNSTNVDMDRIINAALEPQKMTESEKCIIENTVSPQVTKVSQSAVNDVLLITDSDEEKNSNEKPLPKLVAIKPKFVPIRPKLQPIKPKPTPSTSQFQPTEINHISGNDSSLSFERNNDNISQKIVVVPSSEDKEHMDAASNASIKAKITNELSYINYIFSKCNFADGNKKVDKKWFLKDIHKFTEKTILPIEVIRSNSDEIKAEYGRGSLEKLSSKNPFWNPSKAIGIYKVSNPKESTITTGDLNNQYLPCEKRTLCQTPTSATITQTAAHTSQSVLKSNINTSTSNIQYSSTKTSCLAPTKPSTPAVRVEPTKCISIASAGKVNTTSVVATIQSRTAPIESVAKVDASIRNPTFVTIQNQIVSSVASGCSTNNVAPSAALRSKPYSPSPTSHNLPIQSNRVKTYGRTYKPISPKPVLPVSPNPSSTEDKKKSEQKPPERKQTQGPFLVPNGYILMGVSTNNDEVSQNEDNKGPSISNQPILLNGMPLSSLTNMRNQNPQMVLQPMSQQTNVNIQNCINICHQEVSANTQQQYATITVPVMVPGQNEQQNQIVQPTHQLIQPAQNQVVQTVVAPVQSIDSNESNGSRPAIRIKNLAELTGENSKPVQRNELHNMYTTALSNYAQTNISTVSASQDEYIQIS